MATKAQIAANRRNAQHSTGPRIPEGKSRSAMNALKHGIRARTIIKGQTRTRLNDEDPDEFADLLQALVAEFRPVGAFEESLVENIAIALWRLHRVVRSEIGFIAKRQAQHQASDSAESAIEEACLSLPDFDVVERLGHYEARLERQLNRSFSVLTKLQTMRWLTASRQSVRAASHVDLSRFPVAADVPVRQPLRPPVVADVPVRQGPGGAGISRTNPNEINIPAKQTQSTPKPVVDTGPAATDTQHLTAERHQIRPNEPNSPNNGSKYVPATAHLRTPRSHMAIRSHTAIRSHATNGLHAANARTAARAHSTAPRLPKQASGP